MIHIVIGTRAQLVKMGSLMHCFKSNGIEYNYVSIPQHKRTMDSMLDMFGLDAPDHIVSDRTSDITKPYQLVVWFFRVMLETFLRRRTLFSDDENGVVLVHGDAPPALLGALMAKVAGLKVAHVESGLRSYDIFNPFPEELIRMLTFKLSDYLFAPGLWAVENLKKEQGEVVLTGHNTLMDSLDLARQQDILVRPKHGIEGKYCVFTSHRFENLKNQDRWSFLMDALTKCSIVCPTYFILHPVTQKKLESSPEYADIVNNANIFLTERMDYFDFIDLIRGSEFMMTDGGSNQEEAFYLGIPTLILRSKTERKEGLGINAEICEFKSDILDSFLINFDQKRRKPIESPLSSPSMVILETLRSYSFQSNDSNCV